MEKNTQGEEMEPGAGIVVRKVAGQCGWGFSSKGKSIPLPSELDEPKLFTRHYLPAHAHAPHLGTGQSGQGMECLEGAHSESPVFL